MLRTRVKTCGITSPEDAAAAVRAGADAVGVVFAQSPRQVSLARAREILEVVPEGVTRVGVFVDPNGSFVANAVSACGLEEVQFHGHESPDACAASPVAVVKAFAVEKAFDPAVCEAYRGTIAAGLLDAFANGSSGGTGRTFAWGAVPEMPEWMPLIVAGGLDPVNVSAAIEHFEPFGVDVSSGVEKTPGRKDLKLMVAFVRAVREADRRLGRVVQ